MNTQRVRDTLVPLFICMALFQCGGDDEESNDDAGADDSGTGAGVLVCCFCECVLETGGSPELDERYISGTDISCTTACDAECALEPNWVRGNYGAIECSDMPAADTASDIGGDTGAQEETCKPPYQCLDGIYCMALNGRIMNAQTCADTGEVCCDTRALDTEVEDGGV